MTLRWVNTYPGVPPADAFGTTNGLGTPLVLDSTTGVLYWLNGTSVSALTLSPQTANRVLISDSSGVVGTDADLAFDGSFLIFGKESTKGIKVDSTTPTYPWHDMLGEITTRGTGATDPNWEVYRGGIRQFQFAVNDECWNNYHIIHDYAVGTDLYLHAHWSHIATTVTGGSVTWGFEVSYAKGHNQAAFSAPITLTLQQNASTTQYQHMIAEIQLSAASPTASQLDSDNIEIDGLLLVRTYLSANNMTVSSGGVPLPFLHYVDIHYQSTGIGTKNKAPNFYA